MFFILVQILSNLKIPTIILCFFFQSMFQKSRTDRLVYILQRLLSWSFANHLQIMVALIIWVRYFLLHKYFQIVSLSIQLYYFVLKIINDRVFIADFLRLLWNLFWLFPVFFSQLVSFPYNFEHLLLNIKQPSFLLIFLYQILLLLQLNLKIIYLIFFRFQKLIILLDHFLLHIYLVIQSACFFDLLLIFVNILLVLELHIRHERFHLLLISFLSFYVVSIQFLHLLLLTIIHILEFLNHLFLKSTQTLHFLPLLMNLFILLIFAILYIS